MPLTVAQQTIAKSPARFRVVVAGRRFGKTIICIREAAKFARFGDKKILYVAPTYKMARDIVWSDLKKKLTDLNWVSKINESRLEIKLRNGSLIMLRGADNPDSLRGPGNDLIILDEVADIKPEAWYEVLRPTLSAQKPPGSALFVGTPKGVGNYLKDLYDLGITQDDWESFKFTTLEGGNVPEEEIESARRGLDILTFKQEYEASFETASNLIYYSFSEKKNVKKWRGDKRDLKLIYLLTDFNVSPMATLIGIPTTTGIHIIDEICLYSSNTDEMVEEVRNRYPDQRVIAFPDPAGTQRKTSAGGKTDVSILRNAGFVVKHRLKHPAVRDRIIAVNSMLLNSNDEVRLYIDPVCKELIKCLTRFSYKENSLIPDKGGAVDYSHFPDALGYGVEYLFPVTRDVVKDNTTSWGVF